MKKLTKREDQIMGIVWQLRKASIREILEGFPEPRPHYNTVATLVKILAKKGVLEATMVGNTYQYSPTQGFEEYRAERIADVKQKFFGDSLPKLLAHFAKQERLTEEEKAELIRIIQADND